MDLSGYFNRQLAASLEGFLWSVEQVREERRYLLPPLPLGTWSAARHAFHLLHYEETIALPSMRQWFAGQRPATSGLSEEAAWERGPAGGDGPSLSTLLAELQNVRIEQVSLLPHLDTAAWEDERPTVWGLKSLRWVVTKTLQHTAEHTHDVLSIALYWDMVV